MAMTQTGKAFVGGGLILLVGGGAVYAYKKGLFGAKAVEYTGPSANASGGTVSLVAPQSVAQGQDITVTATASGMGSNPLYNFFFGVPGATGSPKATSSAAGQGWTSTGYTTDDTASVPATTSGPWSVIVYARPASAPPNELQAGNQSTYEADSGGFTVQVT